MPINSIDGEFSFILNLGNKYQDCNSLKQHVENNVYTEICMYKMCTTLHPPEVVFSSED